MGSLTFCLSYIQNQMREFRKVNTLKVFESIICKIIPYSLKVFKKQLT